MDEAILSLEKGAMERWRRGDPWGWAEISAGDVTYVDPGLASPIVGLEASGRICDKSRGILSYNYRSKRDPAAVGQTLWNTTEVYFRRDAEWEIAHTHWSFVQHRLPEQLEIPVPIHSSPVGYEGVLGEVMALETAAMARWRKGDPWGFLDLSARSSEENGVARD